MREDTAEETIKNFCFLVRVSYDRTG